MEFNAAIVQTDGYNFVVIIVKKEVLEDSFSISQARDIFKKFFPLHTIVLMAQDARGDGIYDGPDDIVRYLSRIKPEKLPWSSYVIKS